MSSAEAAPRKMIVLKTCDNETFEVDEALALESKTIKHVIEGNCADTTIDLPRVRSKILAKVIEYCKRHVEAAAAAKASSSGGTAGTCTADKVGKEDLKAFDAEFVKVDLNTLYSLSMAATYLKIDSLLYLTGKTFHDMLDGKKQEEIRKIFNDKTECTPEEEVEQRWRWTFHKKNGNM